MPPFGPLCRWDTWIPHFALDQLTDAGPQGLKSRLSRRLVVTSQASNNAAVTASTNAGTPHATRVGTRREVLT